MEQKRNCFLNGGQIRMHHACERRIIIRTGLDIYGCLLNQSAFGQMLQNGRTSSVGIQFDGIPEGMYFADKIFQIRSKGRFSAGNTDAVQNSAAFFQEREHFFFRDHWFICRMQYKRTVLAERTAEIAASQKDRSGYPSWIIQ